VTQTFCTLFDSNYLPRGLALYRSLERHCPSFRLWVFCMDLEAERILRGLELAHVTIVPLAELERHDGGLLSTKRDRTQVEYCWTATPAVCRYVLETDPETTEVTYLDADLMFFSDPQVLFDEMNDAAVMIVPHRYAAEHQHKELTSGTYNVEWLTFRRDADGLAALHWWHERCIEWCYFRWEDGKLGDQKYLDDWPDRFARVHVLQHPGGGLAPWNVTRFTLNAAAGRVLVDGVPLVFYHYHSLVLYRPTWATRLAAAARIVRVGVPPSRLAWQTNYPVSNAELRLVWVPYLKELGRASHEAATFSDGRTPGVDELPAQLVVRRLLGKARRVGRRASRTVDPASHIPGAMRRYRNSWRSKDVAKQMVDLTTTQLLQPEVVAPYRAFRELLLAVVADPGLPDVAALLDIGCGAGAYGELLERWAPGRFSYIGADYSDEILEAARSLWPSRRFERRDIFEPGALDGFDVVLASALLDVLVNVDDAIDALLRSDARHVILHRQRVGGRRSQVQVAAGYRGQRTYRSSLAREQLDEVAARHGRAIASEVEVEDDIRSYLLTRS
jgi:SAM-dependent methyltransferase